MSKESGFTLIELLVSTVIIIVLGGVSVQAYKIYKKQSYDATVDDAVHSIRIALEAGRTEEHEPMNYWAFSGPDGNLQGWHTDEFVPGLRVTQGVQMWVSYNGWCEHFSNQWCGGNEMCCIVDMYTVRHCKGQTAKSYHVWNNGMVTKMEWDNWGC
jgi:prepilin-type N-terminal cleavage/methylation domain-containing protein